MPAFRGVPGIWHSSGLTDDQGFVPVDKDYRHRLYPEIFAAGVAADLDVHDSEPLPKTGYLATVRAKEAARNLAGAIEGTAQRGRTHLHLTDLRILDGGDAGLLVVGITLIGRSGNLTIPLPGRTAYHAKRLLLRYLLWKFRTGRSNWP